MGRSALGPAPPGAYVSGRRPNRFRLDAIYFGEDIASAFRPFVGSAMPGGFYAWAVLIARGALLPVIVAHNALIVIVQPRLALTTPS